MKEYLVDRAALGRNIDLLRQRAGQARVIGVIKGNGYGLGLIPMAEVLLAHGVDFFAVTELSEVTALRENGFVREEILMMEATCQPCEIAALIENGAILSVGSLEAAQRIQTQAELLGQTARVHVKLDTGMGRFGFHPSETGEILRVYQAYPNIQVCGIYTHFYLASDKAVAQRQFSQLRQVVSALREAEIQPGMVHCCNSTAFWLYPEMHCDAVRLGSALLGRVNFSDSTGLTVIGQCQAAIEEIRTLPKGHTVGYGGGWVARRDTRIAILPIGYINGFGVDRGYDLWRPKDCIRGMARYLKAWLRHKALYVTVNGQSCRVLGHVGMVNLVIDVTDCPCQRGDLAMVKINPLVLKDVPVRFL